MPLSLSSAISWFRLVITAVTVTFSCIISLVCWRRESVGPHWTRAWPVSSKPIQMKRIAKYRSVLGNPDNAARRTFCLLAKLLSIQIKFDTEALDPRQDWISSSSGKRWGRFSIECSGFEITRSVDILNEPTLGWGALASSSRRELSDLVPKVEYCP